MAGGARRDRTDDLLLAKQALSQLSYGPACRTICRTRKLPRLVLVGLGRFELPTSPLSGVRSNQLSYRPLPQRARIGCQPDHAKRHGRQTRTRALITLIEERETKAATPRSLLKWPDLTDPAVFQDDPERRSSVKGGTVGDRP